MPEKKNITYKVWIEIEYYDENSGDSENVDAPGASLATFTSEAEAYAFASRVTDLANGINLNP